jgi:hypothetical protein
MESLNRNYPMILVTFKSFNFQFVLCSRGRNKTRLSPQQWAQENYIKLNNNISICYWTILTTKQVVNSADNTWDNKYTNPSIPKEG